VKVKKRGRKGGGVGDVGLSGGWQVGEGGVFLLGVLVVQTRKWEAGVLGDAKEKGW